MPVKLQQGGHTFLAIKFPDFSLIFPDLIWFSLIKNLNIIAMAPTFGSHILIQMLSEYTANKYST